MLICDTHADTLWNMAWDERPAGLPYDVTKDFLTTRPRSAENKILTRISSQVSVCCPLKSSRICSFI